MNIRENNMIWPAIWLSTMWILKVKPLDIETYVKQEKAPIIDLQILLIYVRNLRCHKETDYKILAV